MKSIHNQEQLVLHILEKQTGVVFLDGPTSCGKTMVIKRVKEQFRDTTIISGELFYSYVIDVAKDFSKLCSFQSKFNGYRCICIEDFDFYGGRPYTEREFATVLSNIANTALVIITGITLRECLPIMFEKLSEFEYYVNIENCWIQQ